MTRKAWNRLRPVLILLAILGPLFAKTEPARPEDNLTTQERQELTAYRNFVPQLVKDLKTCNADGNASPNEREAYDQYIARYYQHAGDLRQTRIDLYRWQIFAGNSVLFVVIVMSLGGFLITAFQIYQLYKLRDIEKETSFQFSLHNVRVTTSVTGIIVLLISFMFLLLFLREVYTIRSAQVETGAVYPYAKQL